MTAIWNFDFASIFNQEEVLQYGKLWKNATVACNN